MSDIKNDDQIKAEIEQAALAIKNKLDDKKGEDIVLVDLEGRSGLADFFIIATGRSNTHVRSLADDVDQLASQLKLTTVGIEGVQDGEWVLMDFGDIVVHVFQHEVRAHYNLEKLWSTEAASPHPSKAQAQQVAQIEEDDKPSNDPWHAEDLDDKDLEEAEG
ncbi:ribosome silencing factor [Magnetococcus sp. PR-3]|uniref:ribosome silencing factor n=1 Tax=Magnetococcus sp. PR-3 TaxID=3120355 RepID=UPI002FCE1605